MEEKVFFMPGDLVTLKQDIPHKPIMIVVQKENKTLKVNTPLEEHKKIEYFIGIKCRWFTDSGALQESI